MKADTLDRRVTALEARRLDADADRSEIRAFLAKLTDEELERLGEIKRRREVDHIEPTEEEACFLAELRTKYGT
jgi:hypothetical protein